MSLICKHVLLTLLCYIPFFTIIAALAYSLDKTDKTESYYQEKIAKKVNGEREIIFSDKTRADIYTEDEVIEVEFAHKWYEAIGQSAHYSVMSGKKPVIWLIMTSVSDQKYVDRCKKFVR